MWQVLGSSVDVVHALLMAAWVGGMPLLFWHRWPRMTRAYAAFAIGFVIVSQGSRMALGECFLTTIARWLWEHPSATGLAQHASSEWFSVRLAAAVFRMSPSHRSIVITSETLMLVTAMGTLFSMRRLRRRHAPS
jgi:hypothetical protein